VRAGGAAGGTAQKSQRKKQATKITQKGRDHRVISGKSAGEGGNGDETAAQQAAGRGAWASIDKQRTVSDWI